MALALALAACAQRAAEPGAGPPSFVLIVCDDLGWGDLGVYGSTVHRTPAVDALAREGLRFTDFYSASSVCTPSRGALLTGCYPRRIGMHTIDGRNGVLRPNDAQGLHPDEVTIAELLGARGYATACIGKWHLGDQPELLPRAQGFDSWLGLPYSNNMDGRGGGPPLPLVEDERVLEAPVDTSTLTRRYTEAAVAFLRANAQRPFFLYLAHTFPHDPPAASEAFRGRSANGAYGDAVEELDWSTGQIVAALDELGLAERTLVLFTSDNGAARRSNGSNGPFAGAKGTPSEGGLRVPLVVRWPGRVPAGALCRELATTMDLVPTLAGLAGAALPADRPIDGRDVLALLEGRPGAATPHEAFFYYDDALLAAVRGPRWKLELRGRRLYDLAADPAETTDRAAEHPDVVQALLASAERARAELGHGTLAGTGERPLGRVATPRALVPR